MPASLQRQNFEYTDLQRQLGEWGVTLGMIRAKTGLSIATISRVLDPEHVDSVRHGSVKKVRTAIREILPSFVTVSFEEYDE